MSFINPSDYSSIILRIGSEDLRNYCEYIDVDSEYANLQFNFSGRKVFDVSDFEGFGSYDVPANYEVDIDLTISSSVFYDALEDEGSFVEIPILDSLVCVSVTDLDIPNALVDTYEAGVDEDESAYEYCAECVTDEIEDILKDTYRSSIESSPCYICFIT